MNAVDQAILELSNLDTFLSPRAVVDTQAYLMWITTRALLCGLQSPKPDESLLEDVRPHMEQAKRLMGGAS